MNAILRKAHSSSNKHTPALPLALVGKVVWKTSCQWSVNISMDDILLHKLMTWRPYAHKPYKNISGDRDGHTLGEPRDERFSPWPHRALSGTIIKPQTWFYHSWKELVTVACTAHPIFLTAWLQQQWRGGGVPDPLLQLHRDISSLSVALWTAPNSGSKQSRWAISWSEYLKAQPQFWWYKCWAYVHSCVIFTGKIPIPWACCIQAKFCIVLPHRCTVIKTQGLVLNSWWFWIMLTLEFWVSSISMGIFERVCVPRSWRHWALSFLGLHVLLWSGENNSMDFFCSQILNIAHLLSCIVIIYLCIM